MCGVAGLLGRPMGGAFLQSEATVRRMADALASRGPDGEGFWHDTEAGVAFGHRRLALVDLSPTGSQPMSSPAGRYVITYNGEVYNHQPLRAELLSHGVRFRGRSDTEVLLALIERWGLWSALERVDGMFAFGLWDRRDRQLHLVRYRFGEKPLVYGRVEGQLLFASDLRAIRAATDRLTLDMEALTQFLRFKCIPWPRTMYREFRKVPPGCVLSFDAAGSEVGMQRFWDPLDAPTAAAEGARELALDEAVIELEGLLVDSVRDRLDADRPVGALLSGGIDSSVIVALAQRVAPGGIKTFTVGSDHAGFDERSQARGVARQLGTEHFELRATPQDLMNLVEELPDLYDEPFADSSQLPMLLVCRLARQHVTAALTGDGADELFGGYNRYVWLPRLWRSMRYLPPSLRSQLARAINVVPPAGWDLLAQVLPAPRRPKQFGLKMAKAGRTVAAGTLAELYVQAVSHWNAPEVLTGVAEPSNVATDRAFWPDLALARQLMAIDLQSYLPDDILTKGDRASMSCGLELRSPYLARSVYEFSAALPDSLLLGTGSEPKMVLRALRRRLLPAMPEIPKSGFGIPLGPWLRGPLRDWTEAMLFDGPVSVVDPGPVRHAWDLHQAGRAEHGYLLWDVAVLHASLLNAGERVRAGVPE